MGQSAKPPPQKILWQSQDGGRPRKGNGALKGRSFMMAIWEGVGRLAGVFRHCR